MTPDEEALMERARAIADARWERFRRWKRDDLQRRWRLAHPDYQPPPSSRPSRATPGLAETRAAKSRLQTVLGQYKDNPVLDTDSLYELDLIG